MINETTEESETMVSAVCPQCGPLSGDCRHGEPLLSQADEPPKDIIEGRYRLESLIATGGWSKVYSAVQLENGRIVAVKILQRHICDDPATVARFQTEAESAGCLCDPGIVQVYDYGLLPDGSPYLVMELVEGDSLSSILAASCMEPARALDVTAQVASALQSAHDGGIVHRDVKPSNIMITNSNQVKLLDFGVAKILSSDSPGVTCTGESAPGTAAYMSPEQCYGQNADHRSDIYSLGCVLYEMICGRKPVEGRNPFELIHQHKTSRPGPLSQYIPSLADTKLGASLQVLIDGCLAKEVENRYQSCDELINDIQRIQRGEAITPRKIVLKKELFDKRDSSKTTSVKKKKTNLFRDIMIVSLASFLCCLWYSQRGEMPLPDEVNTDAEVVGFAGMLESQELEQRLLELREAVLVYRNMGEADKALELEREADKFKQMASAGPTGPVSVLVGVPEGKGKTPTNARGEVTLRVTYKGGPITLTLSSGEPVLWNIQTAPGVKIDRVRLMSARTQKVGGLAPTTQVETIKLNGSPMGAWRRGDREFLSLVSYMSAEKIPFDIFEGESHESTITVGPEWIDWKSSFAVNAMEKTHREVDELLAKAHRHSLASLSAGADVLVKNCSVHFNVSPFSITSDAPKPLKENVDYLLNDPSTGNQYQICDNRLVTFAKGIRIREVNLPRSVSGLELSFAFDSRRHRIIVYETALGKLCSLDPLTGELDLLWELADGSPYDAPAPICYSAEKDKIFILIGTKDAEKDWVRGSISSTLSQLLEVSSDGHDVKQKKLSRRTFVDGPEDSPPLLLSAGNRLLLWIRPTTVCVINTLDARSTLCVLSPHYARIESLSTAGSTNDPKGSKR